MKPTILGRFRYWLPGTLGACIGTRLSDQTRPPHVDPATPSRFDASERPSLRLFACRQLSTAPFYTRCQWASLPTRTQLTQERGPPQKEPEAGGLAPRLSAAVHHEPLGQHRQHVSYVHYVVRRARRVHAGNQVGARARRPVILLPLRYVMQRWRDVVVRIPIQVHALTQS